MGGVAVNITAGGGFTFTGMEFGVDNGHGVFSISGTVANVAITGNMLTAGITGTPFSAQVQAPESAIWETWTITMPTALPSFRRVCSLEGKLRRGRA